MQPDPVSRQTRVIVKIQGQASGLFINVVRAKPIARSNLLTVPYSESKRPNRIMETTAQPRKKGRNMIDCASFLNQRPRTSFKSNATSTEKKVVATTNITLSR